MLESLIKKLKQAQSTHVLVGFSNEDKEWNGEGIANIAVKNEFGLDGVPARPFMRTVDISNLNINVFDYNDIGNKSVNAMRESIDSVTSPPLSQLTLEKRKENRESGVIDTPLTDKPLKDSLTMYNNVKYVITYE